MAQVWPIIAWLLGLIGPYVASYVPVLRDYTTTEIPFGLPRWAVASSVIAIAGLLVLGVASFLGKRKAYATAAAAAERAASAEQRASTAEADAAKLRAEIERRDWRAKTFRFAGVDWPLAEQFWQIVTSTAAGDFTSGNASMSLLNGSIGDPLCRKCRREIWPCAAAGLCVDCNARFNLGLTGNESVDTTSKDRLKCEVYFEARAKYFRRQHGAESQA